MIEWQTQRLGWIARTIVPQRDKPTSLSGDIPWIRIEDFDGKYISTSKSNQGVTREQIRSMPLRTFPKGTVVTSCSCTMGATAIADRELVTNQTFIGLVPNEEFITSEYLYWSMQGHAPHLQQLATGAIQQYLSQDDFKRLRLLIPDLADQRAIADFLDRETAKIDALIDKQRELLERLPARVQAVIDSSVAGYPRVPIRRDAKAITSGSRDWARYYSESGTPFLRITNLPRQDIRLKLDDLQHVDLPSGGAEGERTRCESEDLLFSITAYLGSVALVPAELAGSFISQHVCLVRLRRDIWDPRFAALAALSTSVQDQLAEGAYGGTKIQLSLPDIASLELPAPDLSVQNELANRIQRELGNAALVRERVERHISLAQERRSALITAAVTGQLEIPVA